MSGHSNPVTTVAFSPDGTRIVTASLDGTARVWKAETGAELAVLRGHRGAVTAADSPGTPTSSPAARTAPCGSGTCSGARPQPPRTATRPVSRAFFVTPDRVEAVTGDGRGHVFDLEGRPRRLRPVAAPRRSGPPSGRVAVPTGNTVTIHEPDGHDIVLRGHTRPVTSVRFSSDGNLVVTASRDTTARIWDAHTGAPLHALRGHFGVVDDASFSPDGRWVVTPARAPRPSGRPTRASSCSTFGPPGPSDIRLIRSGRRYDRNVGRRRHGAAVRCDICRSGPALVAVASQRLAKTGRVLSTAEKAQFSP